MCAYVSYLLVWFGIGRFATRHDNGRNDILVKMEASNQWTRTESSVHQDWNPSVPEDAIVRLGLSPILDWLPILQLLSLSLSFFFLFFSLFLVDNSSSTLSLWKWCWSSSHSVRFLRTDQPAIEIDGRESTFSARWRTRDRVNQLNLAHL